MDLLQLPSMSNPASFFIIPIFFIFFVKLIRITKSSTAQNLPPGPRKLPLIGNMHNLILGSSSVPHRALHELSQKFGPVMHLQLGEISTVVISSPDAAKQVMKTHDINFASRPSFVAPEILSYNCTSVSFVEYGDYWRQLRKICTLELLSVKRVQSFRSLREEAFLDLMAGLVAANNEGSSSPVNLTEKLYACGYALITRTALGQKSKANDRFLPSIKEIIAVSTGLDIADVYPSIKLLQMMSGLRRKLMKLHHVVDKIFDQIIHDHKEAAANSTKTDDEQDLVDVLLGFQDDGLEISLTDENIKAVILDMMGGGSETSATAIDWAMTEMLRDPRVLEKAQEEVRRVFDGKGCQVDESNISELKYLKAVIKETMRLHAPLPLLLPRKCREKCKVDGYEIPVDTKIIVNAWAINRDPEYWKNPDSFEPERFLDSLVDYKGTHFEYIPFGAGRRICPGISFGMANVELQLAMFLYHFDWKLPDGIKRDELDMTERSGLTARRNDDLFVVPVIKRPLPPPPPHVK